MIDEIKYHHILKKLCASIICVMIIVAISFSVKAAPQVQKQVIRVGSFPYKDQMKVDEKGNYSGYGYDYLQEIARYTGWRYEFVNATWAESLDMLARGEIDIMGSVMRSPERDKIFNFSENPMMSGYGVLVTPMENKLLPYEDFENFNGLKVGVLKSNLQKDEFLKYSKENSFTVDIHEYNSQEELDVALNAGEVNAAIMTNVLRSSTMRVVGTFGDNDSYFATTKGNSTVLNSINDAMRQIRLKDPFFNGKLNEQYFDLQASTAISFTKEELEYIKNSHAIPCIYLSDTAPIIYFNEATGKANGISAQVGRLIEERTGLNFNWINPNSSKLAEEIISRGNTWILPAKYYDYDWAQKNNMMLTQPYLNAQVVMITSSRDSDPKSIAVYGQDKQGTIMDDAISKGAELKNYTTVLECVDAVLNGEVDGTLVNSTIASYLVNNPKYAGLQTTPLYGHSADMSMAVAGEADPLLYSILNKGIASISTTEINDIILSEMKVENAGAMATYLYLHPIEVMIFVISISLGLLFALLILLYVRIKNYRALNKTLYTDELTGHPNYRALSRDAVNLMGNHSEQYAIIYMDVHGFKVINDTFGYEMGDNVLIATANALLDFVEPNERMARIHSDIFVLLLHYENHDAFCNRLEKLSSTLRQLTFENADEVRPLFRGGVYFLPEDFNNLDKACDRANYAKSGISHHFSNTFVFYNDVMHSKALVEKELESSMETALERGEFIPYYQPKINAITGEVMGAEALVRWQHPEKGWLSPGEFLPFYERNGFVVKIDLNIFEQVCKTIQNWIKDGSGVVPISVNFSRRHIGNMQLPQKLKDIADCYKVPTSLLEIEVTETEELENVEAATQFVGAIKDFGFNISIDDYGTGYSSISFLQQLPLDVLKLDKKFIMNAMESDKARDIMRYLVMSMQKNNIRILCEGIETKEQRDFVINLNCRYIQGYLYSMPLPREDFEAYLREHGRSDSNNLDFIPITSFEESQWSGADDFLTHAIPSWIVSCYAKDHFPINYISPSLLAELEYSELELLIATSGFYINLMYPDDRGRICDCIKKHGKSTKDLLLQYRLVKKSGECLWIREINKRMVLNDGEEIIMGVCTNITDIVALQNEKSRIIDTLPGGVSELRMVDNGLKISQASDHFYNVIGYSQKEMISMGNDLSHVIYEKDLQSFIKMFCESLENHLPSFEAVFRLKQKNKILHWVTFRGTLTYTSTEEYATIVAYNSDDEMKAREEAEISHKKLEMALLSTGQSVFEYDIQKKTVYSHSGFEAYGIPDGAILDVPKELIQSGFIHPDDVENIRNAGILIESGQERASYEMRVRSKKLETDSLYIWVRVTLSTIFDGDKQPTIAVGVVEDINKQKRFEHAFIQEAQYRKAFTESSLMAYEINLTQDTIQRITGSRGFRLEELRKKLENSNSYSEIFEASIEALVAKDDREYFRQQLSRERLLSLYKNGVCENEIEYRRMTPDGQVLWNSAIFYLALDQLSGDVMGYAYHRDINDRKEMEKGLVDQASRDALTGVINRATAEQMVQEFFSKKNNDKSVHAFLMLDADRFKAINDTYGHQMGDKYLVRLAQVVTSHLRKDDIITRMGGDEFAILLKNLPNKDVVESIAEKIAKVVGGISDELGIKLSSGVSIGVAISPQHGRDFETLYHNADEAMYHAKHSSNIKVFIYGQ